MPRRPRHARAPKEAVVFHAFLPEVLALVTPFKEEFYHVAIITLANQECVSLMIKDKGKCSDHFNHYIYQVIVNMVLKIMVKVVPVRGEIKT